MSELFPYSTQPPEVAALAKIPLPEIYRLVDKAPFKQAQQLALEYEVGGAATIGDIVIIKNQETATSDNMPSTRLVIFNGSIPSASLLLPTHNPIEHKVINEDMYGNKIKGYVLSKEQIKAKAKTSGSRLLAKVGLSSAVGAATAYELSELTVPYVGSPLGIALGAISYLTTSKLSNKRQAKNAQQTLLNFKDYAALPGRGAISFYRYDGRITAQLPSTHRFKMLIDQKTMAPALYEAVKDAKLPHELPLSRGFITYYASSNSSTEVLDILDVSINPGDLIEDLLKTDNDPTIFWTTSLENHAQNMSSAQKELVSLEMQIKQLEQRAKLTGFDTPDELQELTSKLVIQQKILLENAFSAVTTAQKRTLAHTEAERLFQTKKLMNEFASGAIDEPHQYESHIQEMITIMSTALNQLNIDQKDSDKILAAIGEYFVDMRNLLTDTKQIEQFYAGIRKHFSEKLHDLPKWEAVASRFTALDKTIVS